MNGGNMGFWSDELGEPIPNYDPRGIRCLHADYDSPNECCMSEVLFMPPDEYFCPKCCTRWGKEMLDAITMVERRGGRIPVISVPADSPVWSIDPHDLLKWCEKRETPTIADVSQVSNREFAWVP
jgi:hypothetical protein